MLRSLLVPLVLLGVIAGAVWTILKQNRGEGMTVVVVTEPRRWLLEYRGALILGGSGLLPPAFGVGRMKAWTAERDWLLLSEAARAARDEAIRWRETALGLAASAIFILLALTGIERADRAFATALVAYAAARALLCWWRQRRTVQDHRLGWARDARLASAEILRAARQLAPALRARLDRLAMLAAVLADRLEDRDHRGGRARPCAHNRPSNLARAASLAASRRHDLIASDALMRAVEHVERVLDEATRAWDRAAA